MTKDEAQSRRGGTDGLFTKPTSFLSINTRSIEELSMKERREYERFQLALPSRLELVTSVKKEIFDAQTRDISASGAFLLTAENLSEGTRCRLELTVPSNKIKELTGAQSLIKVEGKIVRSTSEGVAICFDGECQIMSLKGS